jgi:acetolactate decarboxylase
MDSKLLTRRHVLRTGAGCCLACAAGALGLTSSQAAVPTEVSGTGYTLKFVGNQRETMMMGKRASLLDLRSLSGRPHLYGIGPMEWLSGEITIADGHSFVTRVNANRQLDVRESYDVGTPFFVWAEVSNWDTMPVPTNVQSLMQLETFVGEAGKQKGLTRAFPFVIRGPAEAVEFHVGNSTPETPPGVEAALHTAVSFTLRQQAATYVGFWSNQHRGIFTHADHDAHVHVLAVDNKLSGHVDAFKAGTGMQISLPRM